VLRITHHHQHIRCAYHLIGQRNRPLLNRVIAAAQPRRIHPSHRHTGRQLRQPRYPVARRARQIRHDARRSAKHPIRQRALTHIRLPDHHNTGHRDELIQLTRSTEPRLNHITRWDFICSNITGHLAPNRRLAQQ